MNVLVQLTPQTPPWQVSLLDGQTCAPPHWPHASHVSKPTMGPHCCEPGTHTGGKGHEHALHAQLVAHDWLPYVLHVCVLPGAQAPEAGTHVASPLQSVSPAGHAHVPPWHVSPPVHARPHAPQFAPSLLSFTHTPLHTASPGCEQTCPHVEPLHVAVPPTGAGHTVQLGPQAAGPSATHAPPQKFVPAGHAHAPATHCCPPGHFTPQPPQSSASLVVSTQAPEHAVSPLLQAMPHAPCVHVACPCATAGHALPQAPQLAGLLVVSTQVPLHSVGVAAEHPVTQA